MFVFAVDERFITVHLLRTIILALLPSVYHSGQRVCIDHCLKLLIVNMGINLRSVKRLMTQDFFQCSNIDMPMLVQQGCGGMPP